MESFFHELLVFFAYSGISIVLFLILLLGKNWKKSKSKRILIFILIVLLLIFLGYLSIYSLQLVSRFNILPIVIILPFALGPLLLNYVRSIYQPDLSLSRLYKKELLPFYLSLLTFSIPFWLILNFRREILESSAILLLLIPLTGIVLLSYYVYQCYQLFKRYKVLVKNNYASLSEVDLNWLNIWLKGVGFFVLLDLSTGIIAGIFPILEHLIYLNAFFLVGLLWYIGYFGINQTSVFLVETVPQETIPNDNNKNQTKKDQFLLKDQTEIEVLKGKLEHLFLNEKLFEDESITLNTVARKMALSEKKLSELINNHLDSNFYEYVNRFRIESFKQRVKSGEADSLTLLAIAFESGFNSKATFNRIFKQSTGLTPSQFKKQIDSERNRSH